MLGTLRHSLGVTGLLTALVVCSSARSDCAAAGNQVPQSEQHTYCLTVTSTSGEPVRIKGSVAIAHPDRFVSIDAETPYELTVLGAHYLLIVGAAQFQESIDLSLSIDGRVATTGSGNPLYSVGDGIPKPGGFFSANYQIAVDTE